MRRQVFGVIPAILLLAVASAAGQEIRQLPNGIYSTDTLTAAVAAGDGTTIYVKSAINLAGSLTVKGVAADGLKVAFVKQAKAASMSQAIDFIDLVAVTAYEGPNSAYVEFRAPNPAPWSGTDYSGRIEAVLLAPEGASVEIDAYYYDVSVEGPLAGLVIPESLGQLDISDITENLEVATANRRINLENISGRISAATSNSALSARTIKCLQSQARFRNEGGDIQIIDFEGAINAKNDFGRITIEDFRPRGQSSFIRNSSAPIMIEISDMAEGQLVVSNRHEDIDISIPDTLSAYFSLTVGDNGVIETSGFPVRSELVERNRLNLISGDGKVDINGSVRGEGNIYIRGTRGD